MLIRATFGSLRVLVRAITHYACLFPLADSKGTRKIMTPGRRISIPPESAANGISTHFTFIVLMLTYLSIIINSIGLFACICDVCACISLSPKRDVGLLFFIVRPPPTESAANAIATQGKLFYQLT